MVSKVVCFEMIVSRLNITDLLFSFLIAELIRPDFNGHYYNIGSLEIRDKNRLDF